MSEEQPNERETSGSDYVNVNVIIMYDMQNVVQFKIKRHAPFKRFMELYCELQRLPLNDHRFGFRGRGFRENQTPAQLGMEDGDRIYFMKKLRAGHCSLPSVCRHVPSSQPLVTVTH